LKNAAQVQVEPLDANFDKRKALLEAAHLALTRALQSVPVVTKPQDFKALVDAANNAIKLVEMMDRDRPAGDGAPGAARDADVPGAGGHRAPHPRRRQGRQADRGNGHRRKAAGADHCRKPAGGLDDGRVVGGAPDGRQRARESLVARGQIPVGSASADVVLRRPAGSSPERRRWRRGIVRD
jgi:hypothetical protein